MTWNHRITPLLRCEVPRANNRRKFSIFTSLPLTFACHWFPRPGFISITRVNILINFWRIVKSCRILSLFVFIPTNPFYPILKFTSITSSIQNVFHFALFFVVNNNRSWGLINLIGQRVCRRFSEQVWVKNIMKLH